MRGPRTLGEQANLREKFLRVCRAGSSQDLVSGYTHDFYRYPARFPPVFARKVIEEFSRPGDTVLDPFVGSGTTVVEGLALGRKVVALDVNPIAVFLTLAKTTPLTENALRRIPGITVRLVENAPSVRGAAMRARGDARFANTPWWIRGALYGLLEQILAIRESKVETLLRCALLKTCQWALDCRAALPSSSAIFQVFCSNVAHMCDEIKDYRDALHDAFGGPNYPVTRRRRVLLRSAVGVHKDGRIPSSWFPIKLVVTSPPYPGVHILYHRWQVRGRRETATPFAIIDSPDGQGPSYFTLGGRHDAGLRRYFETLTAAYSSIARLLHPEAIVVQFLSFRDPEIHLLQFLQAMECAGFEEVQLEPVQGTTGRFWRSVPHRKWYVARKNHLPSGKEVVLFHRPRKDLASGCPAFRPLSPPPE